ncbi:MAG TPA: HAMP domain-containing sensor histidine kinase [Actinomycetota bacterium]|nr:HAMP domain-containing sensor histidine kinase [Actinomycetota bacterium]
MSEPSQEAPRFAEMISKIAHELRSPLTSVKGFSATLLKRWDRFTDEQKLQFIETIHFDAERMGRIVSEVLDLARLETGKLELHPTLVDLHAIATQAAEHHKTLPGADRVVVEVEEGTRAWGDPDRLAHVVGNLIENGVKFSDEGPIEVTARRANGMVELTVTDQGIGIEADLLPTVFDGPAPAGGKATPSGTGLGLYLSRRLVEAHGGTITVESRSGEGATFVVSIPAESPDD